MQRPCIWEARGAALEGWIKPERGERTWSWSGRTLWAPGKAAETLSSPPPPNLSPSFLWTSCAHPHNGDSAGMQRGTQQNRRAVASLLGLVPRGESPPAVSRMEAGGKLAGSLSPDPWKNKSSLLVPAPGTKGQAATEARESESGPNKGQLRGPWEVGGDRSQARRAGGKLAPHGVVSPQTPGLRCPHARDRTAGHPVTQLPGVQTHF